MILCEEKDPLDLPSLLAHLDIFPKFYSKCKKTKMERAALGSVLTLSKAPSFLDPSLCFYGGEFFPSLKKKDSLWKDFPSSFFFLPEIEIRQSLEKTLVIRRTKKDLIWNPPPLEGDCCLSNRIDTPSFEVWKKNIESILFSIQKKRAQKVVLARKTTFSTPADLNPFCWLKKLLLECPSTDTFALQMKKSSLFLGSSPEKLYEKNNNSFSSEAVAGTRKRGKTQSEDEKLLQELLLSAKDQKEFLYVKDFLQKQLALLCQKPVHSLSTSIIQTEKVQHLYHSFHGVLKPAITEEQILQHLHPTPAVNGYPVMEALHINSSLEPFHRGLYSGIVGFTSQEQTSFSVAIRSALIQENSLHAFAGTGIVEGSCPEQEWMELDHKLAHW